MKFQDSYKGRTENKCWIANPERKKQATEKGI